jgi:hypothetical protein
MYTDAAELSSSSLMDAEDVRLSQVESVVTLTSDRSDGDLSPSSGLSDTNDSDFRCEEPEGEEYGDSCDSSPTTRKAGKRMGSLRCAICRVS